MSLNSSTSILLLVPFYKKEDGFKEYRVEVIRVKIVYD